MTVDVAGIKAMARPAGMPFRIGKLGHVVVHVKDLKRSVKFYTEVMGFNISDVYTEEQAPGGMVFLRLGTDHHSVALVGGGQDKAPNVELNHIAFEVATLDEVARARAHLKKHGVPIHFEGRRRAGCQIAVEFTDPDGHRLEIYWGLDQVGAPGTVRPAEEWKWAHTLEDAIADPVRGQDTTLQDPGALKAM